MQFALHDIVLDFPGTRALDDVSVAFATDEVHGLVGENGAGKSSLVGILGGGRRPTAGTVTVDGRAVELGSPADALRLGIAHVSQEGSLVPHLSGAENILLGAEPRSARFVIDRKALHAAAETALARWFPETVIDLRRPAEQLAYADQKIVEILRALRGAARLLILDEPTASLPTRERDELWTIIRSLPGKGVGVVLISHFLSEILALSDRITVLRDGRRVATVAAGVADEAALVDMMLQRGLALGGGRARVTGAPAGAPVLSVRDWQGEGYAVDRLDVAPGEIVGLIGLTGAGHAAFARSLYEPRRHGTGTLTIDGASCGAEGSRGMLRRGVALVPDHRMVNALVPDWTVRENLALVHARRTAASGTILRPGRERGEARDVIGRLAIKASSPEQAIDQLSGGNKQKVAIGKWLFGRREPYRVVIFIEPTEGVDIGAKAEIHRIVEGLAASGAAILVASSDLHEIGRLADRVVPFVRGRTGKGISWPSFSERAFVSAMAGAAA